MIQRIHEAHVGTEFVCEIPEGWNAALQRTRDGLRVIMVHEASPPIVCERDADGIWRQRVITVVQ